VLVECGFVRAQTGDGVELTFTPSLARIAALGSPREIVALYGALHGPTAAQAASDVLAGLCDQDDASPLIGEPEPTPEGVRYVGGAMPADERVIIAQHLMRHGIVGNARPGSRTTAGQGDYAEEFRASEYIAAARVHLGLAAAEAEALSMTEFQQLLEMKFPHAKADDIPSREEYEAAMARVMRRHDRG
jgi:hypothetical protein